VGRVGRGAWPVGERAGARGPRARTLRAALRARWPSAILDPGHARRRLGGRPGRRNEARLAEQRNCYGTIVTDLRRWFMLRLAENNFRGIEPPALDNVAPHRFRVI
jgi:hypothetical protein